ncbi:type II toxin-antitoxin system RelE/ParE family toxin [Sphingomonas sp.]|uniref:type II toxin-antitoxin system RelE/ParE family toxin n=1 Tax=Sphingomonas sp. TaxID=28214 RepID=UPI001B1491CB|nr:type II toxin-antitoxin system RelE/ParE family toxin [Sphingomonas sp.]MBO9714968.1 type II toxin-antitoxin system RelE/ParE family toxin [Sphingomonas sp.]
MVQIRWSRRATHDLNAIRAYVEQFHVPAARRLATRLIALADSLAEFPDRGTPIEGGRRQLSTVWPYLLIYRREEGLVRILGIRHGARMPPDE